MRVVCDTNIIIEFTKISRLDLVKNIFHKVMIPDEVKEELLAEGKGETEQHDIIKAINDWIVSKKVKDLLALESLKAHIGKGEAASIVLYMETKADFFWQ